MNFDIGATESSTSEEKRNFYTVRYNLTNMHSTIYTEQSEIEPGSRFVERIEKDVIPNKIVTVNASNIIVTMGGETILAGIYRKSNCMRYESISIIISILVKKH